MPFTYTYGTLKGEWKNDYYNQLVKDLKATLGTIEGKSEDQIDPADRWFLSSGDAIKFNRGTWGTSPTVPGAGQDIHSHGGDMFGFKWASGYNMPFDAKRTVHIATGYGMVGDGLESSAAANQTAMFAALDDITTYGSDTGAILFFPPGIYVFDPHGYGPIIDVPAGRGGGLPNLTIVGCGPATQIKLSETAPDVDMIHIDDGASLHISDVMLHGNCLATYHGFGTGICVKDGDLRCNNVTFYECGTESIQVDAGVTAEVEFIDIQNCRFIRSPRYAFSMSGSPNSQTAEINGIRIGGCRIDGARDADDWISDWAPYSDTATKQQIYIRQGKMMSASKNSGLTCGLTETAQMFHVERYAQWSGLYTDMICLRANMCLDQDDLPGAEMIRIYMAGVAVAARPFRGVMCAANMCEALDSWDEGVTYWDSQMIHIAAQSSITSTIDMHYIMLYGNISGPAHTAFFCGSHSDAKPVAANHVGFIANLSFRAEPNTNPSDTQSYCCCFAGEPDGDTIMKYGIILGNVYGDSRATADRSERSFSLRNQYVEYCSMLANIGKDTQYAGIWDSASKYSDVSHNIGAFDRDA